MDASEIKRKRLLLYGLYGMTVLALANVGGRIYNRATQRPKIAAVIASDADFTRVKCVPIAGLNDSVEGTVATPQIRTRLYARLDEAGVTFIDHAVRIDHAAGK